MQEKIQSENEERKKKEEEMKRRLQEAQEVEIKYFMYMLKNILSGKREWDNPAVQENAGRKPGKRGGNS